VCFWLFVLVLLSWWMGFCCGGEGQKKRKQNANFVCSLLLGLLPLLCSDYSTEGKLVASLATASSLKIKAMVGYNIFYILACKYDYGGVKE